MRSHTVGGMMKGRWLGGVASALAVLVLAAVPALGITRLGGDALSFWGAQDGSPGEVASAGDLSTPGPLTFEAPAATVRALKEEGQRSLALARSGREPVTDLKDWTYTESDPETIRNLQNFILLQQAFEAYDVTFVQQGIRNGISFDQLAGALFFSPFGLVAQLGADLQISSQIGAATESLTQLVYAELILDQQLLRLGVPLTILDQFLFYQLTVNTSIKVTLLQLALQPPASPST